MGLPGLKLNRICWAHAIVGQENFFFSGCLVFGMEVPTYWARPVTGPELNTTVKGPERLRCLKYLSPKVGLPVLTTAEFLFSETVFTFTSH